MSDEKPAYDESELENAVDDFWYDFLEASPSIRKLWKTAEAAGYKRGYAAARAEIIKAVYGLLDDPPKELPKLIEGPKPAVAPEADPVAPAPPPVAQKAPESLNTRTTSAPPPAKNQAAAELGRLGGLKGGSARAAGMTADERSAAAKQAADARWGNTESTPVRSVSVSDSSRVSPPPLEAPKLRWTAERDALVKEGYPTEPNIQALLKAVNRLPGELVTMNALKDRASKTFSLRRPPYEPPPAPAAATPLPVPPEPLEIITKSPLIAEAVRGINEAAAQQGISPPLKLARDDAPPTAPKVLAPRDGLPAPRPDGFIYATFEAIKAWAAGAGVRFDGGDVDRVNLARKFKGLPPVVIDWTQR